MPLIEALLSIVAPHSCLVCDIDGSLLCSECWNNIGRDESRCYKCGLLTDDFATCIKCFSESNITNVWVRSKYVFTPKDLVHALKFERAYEAHKVITSAMTETIGKLNKDTIIVPIPTSTSRKRERGYDQAELIAKELSRIYNLPYRKYLLRFGNTRQVGSKRKERLSQLKNSYIVPYDLKDKSILLVDDVLTTGATLESAANALKDAGADNIQAAVFARVI